MSAAQTVYAALRARLRGDDARLAQALGGFVTDGLDAVSLSLSSERQALALHYAAGATTTGARHIRCQGVDIPVTVCRGPRMRTHAATVDREAFSAGHGTVGAVVRDRLDPARHYLLSCGHVLAGRGQPRKNDVLQVQAGATTGAARLLDWEPAFGQGVVATGIDAAIATLEGELLSAMLALEQPAGISTDYASDQAVQVRATQPKSGLLKTRWSGYVDIAGQLAGADYFLDDAVGYRAEPQTAPGDSGAAVWDRASGLLLGIHVAAPVGEDQFHSNAVFCPINRIMDWFDVDPLTSSGGSGRLVASSPMAARTAPPRPAARDEVTIVAQTLWGEARGEPAGGMEAVGCVIANRTRLHWRGARNAAEVCQTPYQFSCWNSNDPNRARMEAVARQPDGAFTRALGIAQQVVDNTIEDTTHEATHYFARSLRVPPEWARGQTPCAAIGNHLFFKLNA